MPCTRRPGWAAGSTNAAHRTPPARARLPALGTQSTQRGSLNEAGFQIPQRRHKKRSAIVKNLQESQYENIILWKKSDSYQSHRLLVGGPVAGDFSFLDTETSIYCQRVSEAITGPAPGSAPQRASRERLISISGTSTLLGLELRKERVPFVCLQHPAVSGPQ